MLWFILTNLLRLKQCANREATKKKTQHVGLMCFSVVIFTTLANGITSGA